jgi:hypothetical protein
MRERERDRQTEYVCVYVCVCVYNLSYPAHNAYVPYRHLWSFRLYTIFPYYLINGTIFEIRKVTERNICVDFYYNFCLKHFPFYQKLSDDDKKCLPIFM